MEGKGVEVGKGGGGGGVKRGGMGKDRELE